MEISYLNNLVIIIYMRKIIIKILNPEFHRYYYIIV